VSKLLIIESPGKMKKLGQILGQGWKIVASFGHIRELSREKEDNNAMGFTISDNQVSCHYVPRSDKAKTAWFKNDYFRVTPHGKFDHHCNDDLSEKPVLRLSSLETLKT
jgi:hypothetical protein